MDRLLQVITCCLPCSWLRAASLYVIGSLGGSKYEAVLVRLSGELGLSASNSPSGMAGGSVPGMVLQASEFSLVLH